MSGNSTSNGGSSSSYRRVATSDSLPAPNTSSRGPRFPFSNSNSSRTRTRWIAIGGLALLVLFILYTTSGSEGPTSDTARAYAQRLKPSNWGKKGANPFLSSSSIETYGDWNDQQFDADGWIKGSGRRNLTYDSPFNRDDYSLTEDECDAFFPGLWKEIDRSVEYYTTRQK